MRRISQVDGWLIGSALAATFLGPLAIWNAGYARAAVNGQALPREFWMQSLWAVVALLLGWGCFQVTAGRWRRLAPWGMGLTLVLLALVKVPGIGVEINGAQRWIGAGPLTLQPAEFAKVGCVVFLAWGLARLGAWKKPKVRDVFDRLGRVWLAKVKRGWPYLVVLGACVMIEAEPDLATAMVIVVATFGMLWASPVSLKSVVVVGIFFLSVVGFLVVKEPYRMARITNHASRWSERNIDSIGYQTTMSEMAFASGGLIGTGFGEGRAKHTLPAPTTDFVLTTVGEEFGLVGSLLVIGLLGLIVWRLLLAAARREEVFGRMVLVGVAVWLACQTCVNVMMSNGFFSAIGVPLPFFSYGGSSLIAVWMGLGICASVMASPDVVQGGRSGTEEPEGAGSRAYEVGRGRAVSLR